MGRTVHDLYAWTGKLLFIDLSSGSIERGDTAAYAESFIGGRSLACKIAWDELPTGTGALDPDNILMISSGPLCGTAAPFSGRTTISGLAPQGWPQEWFSRSSLGGYWGPMMKYAGYDGIIIRGRASEPVYLWIDDGQVDIRSANQLWGKGIYDTQRHLMDRHGKSCRVLTIGPAGERLSRIAVVSTGTQSAAGQGGFGAVMGSKNLKAVVVRGSGALGISHPDRFLQVCKAIASEAKASHHSPKKPQLIPERVGKYGQRWQACTQGCTNRCLGARFYTDVPGCVFQKTYKGQLHCAATAFSGFRDTFFDWKLGFEAGFEISSLSNDWGINHWDILFGIIPWLRACVEVGYLSTLDGLVIDLDEPAFWAELLRKIAYREGIGDVLAEGGRRAASMLGIGEEIADSLYPAWGCAGHWDGHGDHINPIIFPFWLVSALQWAVDVRDPISSGHGYTQALMSWSPLLSPEDGLSWDQIKHVGERVYGSPLATDPQSGYAFKAEPAVWHGNRSMLKDSLAVDDQVYPRIYSKESRDGFAGTEGMEGPDFEWHLFAAATGLDMTLEEFQRCGERGVNIERALQIRHQGRSRQVDETIIPYFQREENMANPFLGQKQSLDRDQFSRLLDQYYQLRGWDPETGWPTLEKLQALDLGQVAEELYSRKQSGTVTRLE